LFRIVISIYEGNKNVIRYLKQSLFEKLGEATEFNISDDVSDGAGNMPIVSMKRYHLKWGCGCHAGSPKPDDVYRMHDICPGHVGVVST
jgi:hypothetical protein